MVFFTTHSVSFEFKKNLFNLKFYFRMDVFPDNVSALKVAELKDVCSQLGLSTKGVKKDLIARIEDAKVCVLVFQNLSYTRHMCLFKSRNVFSECYQLQRKCHV